MLQFLEALQDPLNAIGAQVHTSLLRPGQHSPLAGKLGYQQLARVADDLRIHVLERPGV
jgi:hypothetical protein